jgi:hypothetical protein
MELAKAFLARLLIERVIGIRLVKLLLLLVQLSAVLEHRPNLLGLKETVRLTGSE